MTPAAGLGCRCSKVSHLCILHQADAGPGRGMLQEQADVHFGCFHLRLSRRPALRCRLCSTSPARPWLQPSSPGAATWLSSSRWRLPSCRLPVSGGSNLHWPWPLLPGWTGTWTSVTGDTESRLPSLYLCCMDTADAMTFCAHGINRLPARQALLSVQRSVGMHFCGYALLSVGAAITQQLSRLVQGVKVGARCPAVAGPPAGCSLSPLAQPQPAQE